MIIQGKGKRRKAWRKAWRKGHEGHGPRRPRTGHQGPTKGQRKANEGQRKANEGQGQANEGQRKANEGQGQANEGQGQANEGQGQAKDRPRTGQGQATKKATPLTAWPWNERKLRRNRRNYGKEQAKKAKAKKGQGVEEIRFFHWFKLRVNADADCNTGEIF